MHIKRMLFHSLLPLLLIGCSQGEVANESAISKPAPELATLKGHAVFGHDVRTITPCGEGEPLWAIDSTQLLWQIHQELAPGVEPYEGVFVAVRGTPGDAPADGFGADYGGSFIVDQVVYAASEGFGCDLDLSSFHFRLAGNEPFWMMVLTGSTAELNRMDSPQRVWHGVRSEVTGDGFSFEGSDSEHGQLVVSLTEEPCRDTMSGAYHGYAANVTLDGEVLYGCAIRGLGQ